MTSETDEAAHLHLIEVAEAISPERGAYERGRHDGFHKGYDQAMAEQAKVYRARLETTATLLEDWAGMLIPTPWNGGTLSGEAARIRALLGDCPPDVEK